MELKLMKAPLPPATPRFLTGPRPASLFSTRPAGKPVFGSLLSSSPGNKLHSIQSAASSSRVERMDESQSLTLDSIRHSLIRQEDSIIFGLLERAQYCYNGHAYDHNVFNMDGFHGSLVEFMVKETEKLHAQVGRYKSPDEHPFFPEYLPEPILPPMQYPKDVSNFQELSKKLTRGFFKLST